MAEGLKAERRGGALGFLRAPISILGIVLRLPIFDSEDSGAERRAGLKGPALRSVSGFCGALFVVGLPGLVQFGAAR
jgi:hypothetical protein